MVINIVGSNRMLNGAKYNPGNLYVRFSKPIKYDDLKDLNIE